MKKIRISILLVSLLSLFLLNVASAMADQYEAVAEKISSAFTSVKPYPMASQEIEALTVSQAYGIQDSFVKAQENRGETIIGYKAGLTAGPAQKKFGVSEPVRGTLFKSMLRWPGTLYKKNYGLLFIETEIGFKFGKDITEPVKDIESLKNAVDVVFSVIELPDLYYSKMKEIRGLDIIATNAAARQVLIGKALSVKAWDLNLVNVKLFYNGQEVSNGMGKNALGDQWKALQWTVNNVLANGRTIKRGYIVITGSLTKMMPVKPGKYLADFGNLGTMEFEYK
ncbi:MAG: 4-oxalocrotonate decarboxylase [Desulfobacteraceae bacterium]|nr:4-oxalocrotonate decarboxylase [Desulfobacteraceae bacterium]